MKSVLVLGEPPLPEGGALGRCAIALIRGLRLHGVEVTTVAARRAFSLPGLPPQDLGVKMVSVPAGSRRGRARLQRLHRPLDDLSSEAFLFQVREAASGADLVHLEEAETTWCDEGLSLPSLIRMHYRARLDSPLGWPWRRQVRQILEGALLERAATRRQPVLVANSSRVADSLRKALPDSTVEVVPLSLDPSYYAQAALDGPPVAGIIGTGSWPPTAAAIRRLVDQVWPRVRSLVPESRLLVAGRGTASLAVIDPETGVEVLGEVPSSVLFFERLSVLAFPLHRGSGMKVKVLEAMACGVPVVTTALGAEGIAPNPGVVVARTDEELAGATADILRDPAERQQRGREAHQAFHRFYAPAPAAAPLADLYRRMAGAR